MDITFLIQLLLNGVVVGLFYGLVAVGLSLIFGVLEIVNFAHGDFYMLGAMLAFFSGMYLQFDYFISIAVVIIVSVFIGYLLYQILIVKLKNRSFEQSILLTIGVSMVIQNGSLYLWTATPKMLSNLYSYKVLEFANLTLPMLRAIASIVTIITFSVIFWIFYFTRLGKAMRGISQNRDAALMVGIDPVRIGLYAVIIGVTLSGLAGAVLAPIYTVHPTMGFAFIFKAFAIIIIGGLGNISGTVFAALVLGIVESFVGGIFQLALVDAIAFIFMSIVLLVKPEGIWGRGVRV